MAFRSNHFIQLTCSCGLMLQQEILVRALRSMGFDDLVQEHDTGVQMALKLVKSLPVCLSDVVCIPCIRRVVRRNPRII